MALSVTRHSLLMFVFSWTDGGRTCSAFAVPISVTRQWYVRLDAGCCEFLVYRLVTDKAVQYFRLSSQSRVFRCFFAVGSARVTILRKNQTDASVIPLLGWKLFCNSSIPVHPFSVKHVTITANSSFAKTIFSLIFKCVIYIIRLLTRLTSSSGIFSMISLMMLLKFLSK